MSTNLTKHSFTVSREKESKYVVIKEESFWFTGLSGSGKSTLANALDEKLNSSNYNTYILDGDNVRMGLNKDSIFSGR